MSRLRETSFQDTPGWQWDDGPIFVGEESRKHAIDYGKAVQRLEEWEAFAKLRQEWAVAKQRLEALKVMRPAMKKFRFHWLDGKSDESSGQSMTDAFTRLGYGAGATAALDYFEELE
jgi:hypothetical protein